MKEEEIQRDLLLIAESEKYRLRLCLKICWDNNKNEEFVRNLNILSSKLTKATNLEIEKIKCF